MSFADVLRIDVSPLFGPPSAERDSVDRRILRATTTVGAMTINGLPKDIRIDATARHRMLRLFQAPRPVIEGLAGNTRDPSRPLVYHGWFPPQAGRASCYEAFQIGADVARGDQAIDPDDPFTGPTPMPAEAVIPGWREAVRAHFVGMECVAAAVLQSIARGLGLAADEFQAAFTGGASNMRLLRYPPPRGEPRVVVSEPHCDFGCLTLLVQDEAPGLQVRLPGDAWADIPPREGHVVVNCGRLLELWTSGRVVACEHRVLSPGRERFSIPFFYEPRLDCEIAPLKLVDAASFAPFRYRDYVWSSLPRLRRLFHGARPPDLADPVIQPGRWY